MRRIGWPRRGKALRGKDEPGPSRPAAGGSGPCGGDERLPRSGGTGWRDLAAVRAKDCTRGRKRRGARDGPWGALVLLRRQRWGRALLRAGGSREKPVGGPDRPPGTPQRAVARDRADPGNGRGPCIGSPARVGVPACAVRAAEPESACCRLPREGQIQGRKGRNPGRADVWKTERSVGTQVSNQEGPCAVSFWV